MVLRSNRIRCSATSRAASGTVRSISRYVRAQPGEVSCTQYRITPSEYSQSSSGSWARSSRSILR